MSTTFIDRLKLELAELAEKLGKLETFLDTLPRLPQEDLDLLDQQVRVMTEYKVILEKRLARVG